MNTPTASRPSTIEAAYTGGLAGGDYGPDVVTAAEKGLDRHEDVSQIAMDSLPGLPVGVKRLQHMFLSCLLMNVPHAMQYALDDWWLDSPQFDILD